MDTIGVNQPHIVGAIDNPVKNMLDEVASELRDMAGEIERGASAERTWGFAKRMKSLAMALDGAEVAR